MRSSEDSTEARMLRIQKGQEQASTVGEAGPAEQALAVHRIELVYDDAKDVLLECECGWHHWLELPMTVAEIGSWEEDHLRHG